MITQQLLKRIKECTFDSKIDIKNKIKTITLVGENLDRNDEELDNAGGQQSSPDFTMKLSNN